MQSRTLGILGGAAAVGLLLTGCAGGGGGGSAKDAASTTLTIAMSTDMTTFDPSTVYQYEGNQVLTSVYEGLLQYKEDSSTDIEPLLATDYSVSDDGLTYTFTLRDDVKFSDGTVMDSAAVQKSFERLTDPDVQSQMSYILADVASYDAPDATTLAITLNNPNSAFLSLLASPFGPKVIDPAVLDDNSGDDALGYLADHTAGTGPYAVTSINKGQQYVLERNDSYWGDKPFFEKVDVRIIPDAATQLVQFQRGDIDIVSGQPTTTVQSLEGNKDYQIVSLPTLQKAQVHLKVTGALADEKLRSAVRSAIDRDGLVSQVWGDYATPSESMYPASVLADGDAADDWSTDPSELESAGSGVTLSLGYLAGGAQEQQVAETLQTQLQAAGITVELVPAQSNDIYSFSSNLESAPDLFYEASYPDSAHPDAWSRLFWYSDTANGSGVLNYLLAGTPDADALMDQGVSDTDEAASAEAYATAGDAIHDQVGYLTLADVKDTFLVNKRISGTDAHWLPCPRTLVLAALSAQG